MDGCGSRRAFLSVGVYANTYRFFLLRGVGFLIKTDLALVGEEGLARECLGRLGAVAKLPVVGDRWISEISESLTLTCKRSPNNISVLTSEPRRLTHGRYKHTYIQPPHPPNK